MTWNLIDLNWIYNNNNHSSNKNINIELRHITKVKAILRHYILWKMKKKNFNLITDNICYLFEEEKKTKNFWNSLRNVFSCRFIMKLELDTNWNKPRGRSFWDKFKRTSNIIYYFCIERNIIYNTNCFFCDSINSMFFVDYFCPIVSVLFINFPFSVVVSCGPAAKSKHQTQMESVEAMEWRNVRCTNVSDSQTHKCFNKQNETWNWSEIQLLPFYLWTMLNSSNHTKSRET